MPEIKLARRLDKTVVGWIVKVDINGRRRGLFFKHRRAAEFYLKFLTKAKDAIALSRHRTENV